MPSLDARIRAFVEGMLDFEDRTSHWWPVFEAIEIEQARRGNLYAIPKRRSPSDGTRSTNAA